MTTAPGVTAPAPRDTVPVPALADGVQLIGEMRGSGYRRPPALVRRADGQTVTLTPLLYLTLRLVDGRRGLSEIATALSQATGRAVVPDDVAYLLDRKLRPLGLLEHADGSQPTTRRANPLLALRLKFVITNQAWTRRLTAPFAWLFNPVWVLAFVAGFGAVSWWLLVDKGLASAVHQAFYAPNLILALWALVVLSAGFHEFGHAAACQYGGATPRAMGAGLYLVWPAFYTDVTDSYRLGRGGRLRVDLGGLYFNAIFSIGTLGLWALSGWDALLLVVAAQHVQMVRQLAPFIRADGYHIIADITGVPDLFAHIKPTLQGVLPRRWRPATPPALKRWARAIVVLWVLTVVPLLAGLIALATLYLPRLAATAWDSMNLQWDAVNHYWAQGDMLGVLVRGLASVVVCLPVAALLYLLLRIARRGLRWAWLASEDDPRRRAAVIVTGAGILAAVAWAWWPQGQYQPVEPDERGALGDLVRVEDRRVFLPLLQREAVLLRTGPLTAVGSGTPAYSLAGTSSTGGTTLQQAAAFSSVDLGDQAQVAELQEDLFRQVLVRETWPFPWDPPDPTEPGDNRALAVNTVDGSMVTDLAVAWSLVTANEVAQRNDAWALASCTDCTTRAVAFQVLLLLNSPEVVAPENVAVAANYDCRRCTTEAIAVQLVVSITGMPSQEAQQLIQQAMDRVSALDADLDQLSGGQIYYLLNATQAEIMQVLEADGVLPDLGLAFSSAGTATATESESPTESAEPTDSASVSGDSQTTTEPSSEPSAGTTEPTGEPTTSTDEASDVSATSDSSPTSEPTSEPTTEPSPATTEPTSEPAPDTTTESSSTDSTAPSEPTASP